MELQKQTTFLLLCLAFILGIAIGRIAEYKTMAILAMVLSLPIFFFYRKVIIFLVGICLLLGVWRFQHAYSQKDIVPWYGQEVEIIGVIVEEVDFRKDKTYLTLGEIEVEGVSIKSRLLVSISTYPEFSYGQRLTIRGTIEEPAEFEDFSYKNYLSRFNIHAVMYRPAIKLHLGFHGNILKFWILNIKAKFTENISRVIPEPHAALVGGLLLGTKRSLPEEITEQFRITGVSHIVAISGFNITVVAASVGFLLQYIKLHKMVAVLLQSLSIWGFVLMTGAQASVVRAGIMGILLLWASSFRKEFAIHLVLVASATGMLMLNPQILHFDIGFQLSFTAFLGLIYFTDVLAPYFNWVPKGLRGFLVSTLAAQIFTIPLLLYYFGLLSILAPIANVLILLVVPVAMLLGALVGLAGFISSTLALIISWPTWLVLEYILKVSEIGSKIPLASLNISWPLWCVILYYISLTVFLSRYFKSQKVSQPTLPWNLTPGV